MSSFSYYALPDHKYHNGNTSELSLIRAILGNSAGDDPSPHTYCNNSQLLQDITQSQI